MKNSKLAKRNADRLNSIIHTRNLYANNSRFVNAQPLGDAVTVEDLHTGLRRFFIEGQFTDCRGEVVTLN